VTIPAAIRARLGLKPKDMVRFEMQGDVAVLKPAKSKVLETYGAVTPRQHPEDWRGVRVKIEEAIAEDVASEGR